MLIAKCDKMDVAHKIFELMPSRNLTSWNVMLDAYMQFGGMELAYQLFNTMLVKNAVSWNIMIGEHAKRLGRVKVARELFNTMPYRGMISWNAMISGYKENGISKDAIELSVDMHLLGERPDCSTLAIILSAIADLGLFVQGRYVHGYVDRNQFPLISVIWCALIDVYSKCGYVDIAMRIFDCIPKKCKDHCNAMISGLAVHGYGKLAVSLVEDMEPSFVGPDDITFFYVLTACSHAGLAYEGQQHLSL
ncbi:pentatricopeptide repeat-containing protein At2g45350, chloroplastic-like [Phoenix dactylifera]|uniref:Pentatricopeptide repeat-containing protein At2g45350, chloroplastic-like n=1 Tax=Phoenix dactylifera TaxID=42345 RepID=A0A8B8J301_PHODC|nr:pentatricopeptide repeat-containing protein At2g45350, chloroplastic-like [Phoenix dactylifera]